MFTFSPPWPGVPGNPYDPEHSFFNAEAQRRRDAEGLVGRGAHRTVGGSGKPRRWEQARRKRLPDQGKVFTALRFVAWARQSKTERSALMVVKEIRPTDRREKMVPRLGLEPRTN